MAYLILPKDHRLFSEVDTRLIAALAYHGPLTTSEVIKVITEHGDHNSDNKIHSYINRLDDQGYVEINRSTKPFTLKLEAEIMEATSVIPDEELIELISGNKKLLITKD